MSKYFKSISSYLLLPRRGVIPRGGAQSILLQSHFRITGSVIAQLGSFGLQLGSALSFRNLARRRISIIAVCYCLMLLISSVNCGQVYDHTGPTRPSGPLPPVQCYSCMSETYDPYMADMIQQGYRRQDVVTNRCNEPFFSRGIPYVNCSNICVTMKETIQVGGIRVVTAYIRGCLDKILTNYRFNETALLTYNFYRKDHCRELPRSMLIGPTFSGNVWFCACYGNRCNKAATSGRHFQPIGQYLLNYLFEFLSHLQWTCPRTFSRIQDQVTSWLVLVASSLLHFGSLAFMRWLLT